MQPPENHTLASASLDRAVTRLRQAVGYLNEWHAGLTDGGAGRSYVDAGHDAVAAIEATVRALHDARTVLVAEIRRDEDDRAARVDEICPIERAAALSELAARMGHRFPRPYATLRRSALRQARTMIDPDTARPYTLVKLATRVGVHFTRIWQIIQRASSGAAVMSAPINDSARSALATPDRAM